MLCFVFFNYYLRTFFTIVGVALRRWLCEASCIEVLCVGFQMSMNDKMELSSAEVVALRWLHIQGAK